MIMSEPITVLIADDHTLVRQSLAHWLREESNISVVGQVSDADKAIEEALRLRPNVVIMDVDMPGRQCFDAARTINARLEKTRVLFLSAFSHDNYIESALAAAAAGYITKSEPPETVAEAVRAVAAGGAYFSREVQARIVIDSRGVRLGERKTRVSMLSPREMEVLRYIARGMSKKEIAGAMHISVKTVDNHSTSLMSKLDLHDRVAITRFAIREGIAEA